LTFQWYRAIFRAYFDSLGNLSHQFSYTQSTNQSEDQINKNISKLGKTEEVKSSSEIFTPDQRRCEEIFANTVRSDIEGRVIVRPPFKDDCRLLGESIDIASNRFRALRTNISNLCKSFKIWVTWAWLINPNSTKLPSTFRIIAYLNQITCQRTVVFDASCHTSSQKSLNDLLLVGPTLQPELYRLILQFPIHRYAITANVVKMFRKILVDKKDRRFQCVLCRKTPLDPLRTYLTYLADQ